MELKNMGTSSRKKNSVKNGSLITNLLSSKLLQVLLLVSALSFVYLFYSFATTKQDFLQESRAIFNTQNKKSDSGKKAANIKMGRKDFVEESFEQKQARAAKTQAEQHLHEYHNDYHILFIFTKVNNNPKIKEKFKISFGSLFKHAKFEEKETLHLHFVCDENGRVFAEDYLRTHVAHPSFALKVHFHLTTTIAQQLHPMVNKLQSSLGQKHPYYEDAVFFLSLVLHKILPENVHRVVQLDLDLKLTVNIRDIWNEFSYFSHDTIIGLAHENQPVYRHLLWNHRKNNPGTKFGDPLPSGNPGFNSGVILLHLDKMKTSSVFNSFLDESNFQSIVDKFTFVGHLGDQDFYTLLSFEHPELFYALDCVWNRQLCTWWKNKGYEDVFDRYHRCDGEIKIWHGNCDTPIPA